MAGNLSPDDLLVMYFGGDSGSSASNCGGSPTGGSVVLRPGKAQAGESIWSNPVGSGSVSLLGGGEKLFLRSNPNRPGSSEGQGDLCTRVPA